MDFDWSALYSTPLRASYLLLGPWKAPRMATPGLGFQSGAGESSGGASLALAQAEAAAEEKQACESQGPGFPSLISLPPRP